MNGLNISQIVDTLFELGFLYLILWNLVKPLFKSLEAKFKNPKVSEVISDADKIADGIVASQTQLSNVFGANEKQKATQALVARINNRAGVKLLTEATASERIELAYQKYNRDQGNVK